MIDSFDFIGYKPISPEPYSVSLYRHSFDANIVLRVSLQSKMYGYSFEHTTTITDEELSKGGHQLLRDVEARSLRRLRQDLALSGDYPSIRLWAEEHGAWNGCVHSNSPIPGFVFQKWKMANPGYVADKTKLEVHVKKEKEVPKQVTIKRAPLKTPPKNKKVPLCKIHGGEMTFDAVRNVWVCTFNNCDLIARPKRQANEGEILLGKGQITTRVVYSEDGIRVVLISDDNVALDITEFMSTQSLKNFKEALADVVANNSGGVVYPSLPISVSPKIILQTGTTFTGI